jgi:ELWxxDGT repeat protein
MNAGSAAVGVCPPPPTRFLARNAVAPRLIVLAFALVAATAASAGQPRLVADLDPAFPDPLTYGFSATATAVGALGNQAFFAVRASGDGSAPDLLVTDGTAARTRLIAAVSPSLGGNAPAPISNGELLYFFAGSSLWRSDGTAAGTFELAEGAIDTSGVALLGKQLVFTRCAPCAPWITDGTRAGTRSLAAVAPALDGIWSVFNVAVGGRVYFVGPPSGDNSVWTTDGTAVGTHELWHGRQVLSLATAGDRVVFFTFGSTFATKDLWSLAEGHPATLLGSVSGDNHPELATFDGLAYWRAYDPLSGTELWRSDGTPSGTTRITDLSDPYPFYGNEEVPAMAVAGGQAFFVANDAGGVGRLSVTTGTPASTRSLSTGCAEECPVLGVVELVPLGNRVLFAAGPYGRQSLWVSDGTAAGTRRLAPAAGSDQRFLALLDGRALFSQTRSGNPEELWISDGTPAGTRLVVRLSGVYFDSDSLRGVVADHRVFFAAFAGRESQFYMTDGTAAGTRLIAPYGRNGMPSRPSEVVAAAGGIGVFTGCHDDRWSLWRISADATPTAPLSTLLQGGSCGGPFSAEPPTPVVVGERVFMRALTAGGASRLLAGPIGGGSFTELLPAGTSDLVPVSAGVAFFVDKFFFTELWTSDGTPAGMRLLGNYSDIESGPLSLDARHLLFTRVDDEGDRELWVSDGTAAGTYVLAAVTGVLQDRVLARDGIGYFFIEQPLGDSPELWRSDGTPSGTRRVRAFPGLYALPPTIDMALRDGLVHFVLADANNPAALWRSDGTTSGTQVAATLTNAWEPVTSELTAVGSLLFFRHCTYLAGCELWRSDGSTAGTALVADLAPGATSSSPQGLTSFGGNLLFAASDASHGTELWTSDGTAAGTRLVADLAPGPAASGPRTLRRVGERLYFAADDGIHGEELWSLSADELAGCHSSALALCLNGGRFEVTAFWRDFHGTTGEGHGVALTGDTGYFWFFAPSNVEATLKVLDGRGLNDHVWVFYGALSSVEYALTVRDTETGASRRYYNPAGTLASVGDTEGFGPRGALAALRDAATAGSGGPAVVLSSAAKSGCVAGPDRLCLNGGRFAVTASWRDFAGNTGSGTAVPLSGDTGYFWFFGEGNVEVVLKVLDGRPLNQKFWVFYGALSNVEYMVTVTDTTTGTVRQYRNPSGQFASVADTSAF